MRDLIVGVEVLIICRRWSPHDDAASQSTVGVPLHKEMHLLERSQIILSHANFCNFALFILS